ncbi:hypothetical protein AOQ84DRAFT_355010 [Glonium stellatum]|uniref:Transmembrane protein n=1 Tax=Glonium stellatum TaxID=574774 RepID=A0A8E2EYR3_9PEZI|nr:hypothetical protein AOQ84DRAFT_355010 [Glonium stellatum]
MSFSCVPVLRTGFRVWGGLLPDLLPSRSLCTALVRGSEPRCGLRVAFTASLSFTVFVFLFFFTFLAPLVFSRVPGLS